ncbi:MAG: 2-hydroxymuconate tautomerase family protein [Alicyclobacillus herbarius]|nr:2-hydroxymuconate tautomerase family protein [Alicyclobacillus herbarius]
MPFLNIQLLEGCTQAQKEELIARTSTAVAETLNIPLATVRVVIAEVPLDNWGVAGETMRAKRMREQVAEGQR